MSLVVQHRPKATVRRGDRSGHLPLVQCDYCDEIVGKGDEGRVGWRRTETETYRQVVFLHEDCYERYQGKRDVELNSMSLVDFARHLAHNLQVGTG